MTKKMLCEYRKRVAREITNPPVRAIREGWSVEGWRAYRRIEIAAINLMLVEL